MASSDPVGVLDSGVGGLSILDKIHRLMPGEDLLYAADSAHAPYGGRSADYIAGRCRALLDFFLARGAKAAVLACNTATAAAVADLRAEYALPIIGMEPAVKPAAQQSRSGVVGVLATAGTIDSDKFMTLKNRFTHQVEIITRPCHGLVEQIERLETDEAALGALLDEYVGSLVAKGADTLVLGCTHYSLITGRIAAAAGPGVTILDTGFAVARELQRRLREAGLENARESGGRVCFHSSGDPAVQTPLLSRYWGEPVSVYSLLAPEEQPVQL